MIYHDTQGKGPGVGAVVADREAVESLCNASTSDLDNAVASGWYVRLGSTGGESLAHTFPVHPVLPLVDTAQLTRTSVQAEADARRIAAACRAFAGISTADIEQGRFILVAESKPDPIMALLYCGRIRVLGYARIDNPASAHIGLELWSSFPDTEEVRSINQENRVLLERFIRTCQEAAELRTPTTTRQGDLITAQDTGVQKTC